MAGKSTYLARAMLNLVFRTATFAKPGTLYFSLHTADPTDANITSTELTIGVGGYARASVAVADAQWSAPASSGTEEYIANVNALAFGTASAALGTVTYYGIYDASTGGNLLYSGPLAVSRTIASGDPIQIPAGGAVVRES